MRSLDSDKLEQFLDEGLASFYQACLRSLKALTLDELLTNCDPCLFTIRRINLVGELIEKLLEDYLSPSEREHFEGFLVDLAVRIAGETCGGHKSTAQGVDLEFVNDNVHYVVSVKSGPNWGNSSQIKKLEQDLKNAVIRVQQSRRASVVRPVLGICYGKTRTNFNYRFPGCWKVVGQNFWYLISENEDLYTDIIEPIGYRAKQHNADFDREQVRVINEFTGEICNRFCLGGFIDWPRLVEFNSGNYDLDEVAI
ncbi:MAG: cytosolic protein [Chloroflexi bacterium]|nr:cytosolic protein [Chloroflexota bacterium]